MKVFMKNLYLKFVKINRIIRFLIISDLFIVGGFALIAPIFAIYITGSIEGADLRVLGIAEAIYLFTRSFFQIPAASLIDRIQGDKDNFWAIIVGVSLYAVVSLSYLIVSSPLQLYLVQFLYGLGAAIAVPAWMSVFMKNVDSQHEGLEWGVYDTSVGLGSAAAAFFGGVISDKFGFAPVFISIAVLSVLGIIMLFFVKNQICFKDVCPDKESKDDGLQ